jgi:hypothetical protein
MAGRIEPPRNRRPRGVDLYDEKRNGRYEQRPPRRAPARGNSPKRNASPAPQNSKRKRPKLPSRRGMSFSAKFVVALFFGFVLIYMGRSIHAFLEPSIDITTLRLGNMESQQSQPGIIIRDEVVFQAGRDGRIVFDVQESERVREGILVASIRDIDALSRNEQDMALLEREIINVHEMRHATQSDPLVERVNANLQSRMDRSMHHHMQMNLSEVYSLLDTLTQITHNRNNMMISESLHARNDLNRQHDLLTAQLEFNSNDIYASRSGIMSPIIDGFESRDGFTPRTMYGLNREQVRMRIDHEAIIPGREVQAGDDVFKIVGNTWYVATWMPNEMTQGFTVGTERTIYLENAVTGRFERMPMRIYHINHMHRETFVIFQSSRNVIEFLNQRNVNIRITDNVQSGFRIPSSAIATRRFYRIPLTHIHGNDENLSVLHRTDDGIISVSVQISEQTDTDVYILEDSFPFTEGISLIPVIPTELHHIISDADIRIVRGVYRTNTNVALFSEVNIEGETLEAGGHIMLDPLRNPHIRQFDSIVTDASMVRQGQVVR